MAKAPRTEETHPTGPIDPMKYKRLVGKFARRRASSDNWSRPIEETDDYQNGFLGLLHAIEMYRPELGAFMSYASYWILAYIGGARRRLYRVGGLTSANLRPFTDFVDTTATRHRRINWFEPPDAHHPLAAMADHDFGQWALRYLPSREGDILYRRLWLDQTLEEVGKDYGLTRERIRQIEAKAIKRLRKHRDVARLLDE